MDILYLWYYKNYIHLVGFPAREPICLTTCLLSYTSPSEKGSTLKGKNLLPRSKFFPFRVDLFSEGRQNESDRVTALENVSVLFTA